MNMDRIQQALNSIRFKYADQDPQAVAALESRIEETGRNEGVIAYSDWVRGITFQIPTVRNGEPFQITEFADFEQDLLADYLGYINYRAYPQLGFLPSALVVQKTEGRPSPAFFHWFRPHISGDPETFWVEQVAKAHEHYRKSSSR